MIEKSNCLTASTYDCCKVTIDWFRLFAPVECESLQILPDKYISQVSNTQRYKVLGSGWTIDLVVHIFSNLNY